ncbi:aldehyde dehydrogenase family protein [Lactiplantibacillus plantarum]|uniref:aldehyde dehydrogenase family protein n=1 Tax=Lactiplantibacillus plantarum TaxID=1590 RepID=UPI004045E08B
MTGNMLIGAQAVKGAGAPLHAIDPARGEPLQPGFCAGTAEDVARAAELAAAAFDPYRAAPLETRAQFLESIAEGILALGDALIAYNIIKQIGNYGESFEATLGKSSAMKLDRGLNASYKQGGLMYGWPVR